MGKRLVRDRIDEVPWTLEEGKRCLRPVNDDREHLELLKAKLIEESAEVITAESSGDIAEEIADVMSVLEAYAKVHCILWGDIIRLKRAKDRMRGGFTDGVVLEL